MKTKPMHHHTILWADDDPDDLLLIKEIVEKLDLNLQLVEAANGSKVLEYLDSFGCSSDLPCLVVLDMNMPILNGKETLAKIKSVDRYDKLKVAIFTTSFSNKDKEFFESYGANVYKKPPTYEGLKNVIGEVITHCRS